MAIDVAKILEIIKDPDLKLKINDLYSENLSLKEENHELRKKLAKSEELKDIRSKLLHVDNHYFLLIENDTKDGPYCTKCFDADEKLVHLHKGNFSNGVQYFSCPNCKTHTSTGNYIPAPMIRDLDW